MPLGMRLSTAAGWNQTQVDWQRALELEPDGAVVAWVDGQPVGTATSCVFGPVAWIALVLVDARCRGQGIGRALFEEVMRFLDARGVEMIRLDATALGHELYAKFGFQTQYELARFRGQPRGDFHPGQAIETARVDDFDAVAQLDCEIGATDRQKLLTRLFDLCPERAPRVVRRSGRVSAVCFERPGTLAVQIGPCLGDTAAEALMVDALARHAGGPVCLDVPSGNQPAVACARAFGLQVERPLVRMFRGPAINDQTERLWASSGPEKG